jgi:very-short-patch-repair endonuclease
LKSGQLDGLRFRKQHPIGLWIADFYCHEASLVVEVDGWTHCANRDHDRDAWMAQRRIGVLRFDAAAVFGHLTGVLAFIKKAARERIELLNTAPNSVPSTECSSPAAGGGGGTQAKRV